MSDTGPGQPSYGSGWGRKKKRYRERDFGRDQDYYESQPIGKDSNDEQDKSQSSLSQPSTKPPVILAKPGKLLSSNTGNPEGSTSSWQEVAASPSAPMAPKVSMTFSRSPQSNVSERKLAKSGITEKFRGNASPGLAKQSLSQISGALNAPATSLSSKSKDALNRNIKLLDSSLHWNDEGIEQLQDQSDFMVVGVIGMQGVGKSTVMSIIGGNHFKDAPKSFLFRQQTPEVKERANHMTTGIDFAITNERIILLDTQPILSPSLLEQSPHYERKNAGDYNSSSSVEIQSLQIAAFLLTVCHVIVVVQDWFTDSNVYKFLQTAEMLKPVTTPPVHDSGSTSESDQADIQPVIVFVHNKIDSNMFNIRSITAMNEVIANMVKFSSVHCKGYFSLIETNLYPGLGSICPVENEVNAFIIPNVNDIENEEEKCDVSKITNDLNDRLFLSMPSYAGRPSTSLLEITFRKMILSMPRHQLTRLSLTEKNWFHYAARTWETIRKSQLVSEYNRLLSG